MPVPGSTALPDSSTPYPDTYPRELVDLLERSERVPLDLETGGKRVLSTIRYDVNVDPELAGYDVEIPTEKIGRYTSRHKANLKAAECSMNRIYNTYNCRYYKAPEAGGLTYFLEESWGLMMGGPVEEVMGEPCDVTSINTFTPLRIAALFTFFGFTCVRDDPRDERPPTPRSTRCCVDEEPYGNITSLYLYPLSPSPSFTFPSPGS
ncbi:hypothetical protein BCR34DRAFT_328767 [Clohesyomyces aquaticus]|uniref:Uncharacterized protein n=1 Tax=Clohesyomyces aquaticus TaxID=1231657 RepID=A0A1Y1ZLV3_9PLEO|nr:hypothetical protein BCR34DRAFT_328767 [Clohesyomyces aquaticus]